jgi:hypothetical protein
MPNGSAEGGAGRGPFLRQGGCTVEGCPNPGHAKGYCRKHYGQVWRYGRVGLKRDREPVRERSGGEMGDEIRSVERELQVAQQMYEHVIGYQGRIRWAGKIREARAALERLKAQGQEVVA